MTYSCLIQQDIIHLGGNKMNYEIVELAEKQVEGIAIQTSNQTGKAIQEIGQTWQRFFTERVADKIQGKVNTKTIGLYTNYESDYTGAYQFIAGVEINQQKISSSQETVIKTIPKGKYAKFSIHGDIQQSVGEAWAQIWQMDLKRTYTGDFEEYQNNNTDPQNQEIHIYIAIK